MPFTDPRFLLVFLPVVLGLRVIVSALAARMGRRLAGRSNGSRGGDGHDGRRGGTGGAGRGAASWIVAGAGIVCLAAGSGGAAAMLGGAAAATLLLGLLIDRTRRRAAGADGPSPDAARTRPAGAGATAADADPARAGAARTGPTRAAAAAAASQPGAGALPEIAFALAITLCLAVAALLRLRPPADGPAGPWLDLFAGGGATAVPGLLAPLGAAVVVCHAVSFVVDVYRGEAAVPRSPGRVLAYLLCLPCLAAGPVLRYRDAAAAAAGRDAGMAAAAYGARRIVIGVVKVRLVAGTLAGPADAAFAAPPDALGAAAAWIGLACAMVQICVELSGCADVAIGIGRMLGLRLPETVRRPYAATSLCDFWRRWNMTLAAWCTAYLGLRLDRGPAAAAGDAPHPGRTGGARPIAASALLPFAAIGLWYGGSAPVLTWAALHGVGVALERSRPGAALARLPRAARRGYVLAVVALGWVVFRADTVADAGSYLLALSGLGPAPPPAAAGLPLSAGVWLALAIGALGAAPMPAVTRWSVTVDAVATALQMIATTAGLFVWTRLAGRRRPPAA